MSPEFYDGPERRKGNASIEHRLTKLEVGQEFLAERVKEVRDDTKTTRDAVESLSVKFDAMLKPLSEAVGTNTTDIAWLKSWFWHQLSAAAASGGVIGALAEFVIKRLGHG